jgi:predicted negative regulator of RcsB-dependent stress response
MSNELIKQTSWWKRNWKKLVPVCGVMLILIAFFSSRMVEIVTDLTQAYADTELYEKALEMAKSDPKSIQIVGRN